jgi:hypothetical protein
MSTILEQNEFIEIVQSKFSDKEQVWLEQKRKVLLDAEAISKFSVFFSLVSRFVSNNIPEWSSKEMTSLELIYPGFGKSTWNKQELARVILMISLAIDKNKEVLESFYESAEMQELVAFFKGLYLLENAKEFSLSVEEGIRTNMVNVFDAFTAGNPFAIAYLDEWAWNQLVLKAFFLERPLFTIHDIDKRKNQNLAEMLQDYVKERWSAFREVSPEIWRLIEGSLRDDVYQRISQRELDGLEKDAITHILENKNDANSIEFWNNIGKLNLKNK